MQRLIEFPLQGGGSVVVEMDEPEPEAGVTRAAEANFTVTLKWERE